MLWDDRIQKVFTLFISVPVVLNFLTIAPIIGLGHTWMPCSLRFIILKSDWDRPLCPSERQSNKENVYLIFI